MAAGLRRRLRLMPPCVRQVGEIEKNLGDLGAGNPYAALIDEAEGLDKIEELQNHNNEEIYEKAVNILETFFDVEEGEVENLAPGVDANQGTYVFGGGQMQGQDGGFGQPSSNFTFGSTPMG